MPLVAFISCCILLQLALKLLNNVAVSLLTWSSVLPCVLLVIHAPYDYDITMISFLFVSSYCLLTSHTMLCSVVSGSSSPTCLLIVVSAMLCFSSKSESVYETFYVYMGAIISSVPFWLIISKGLLFYAFSRFMSCLCLLCYFPVACCLLALNIASLC